MSVMPETHHLLSTGREGRAVNPHITFLPHYRVVDCPGTADPTPAEVGEMLQIAHRTGQALARAAFDDPGAFSLLLNAPRTRRRPWFHIHLIPARSPREKWWALFTLSQKRWLRALVRLVRLLQQSRYIPAGRRGTRRLSKGRSRSSP